MIKLIFKTFALIGAVFKSLLSGYLQVLWALLAIVILKNQDIDLLTIPNLEIFNKILSLISLNWMWLVIFISMFYLYCNVRQLFPRAKPEVRV